MAKSISQLNTIPQAHDSDLFEVAAVDAQSSSGYTSGKMTSEVLAEGMLSTFTYPTAMPDMQNKTITGALNQLLANFAPVYDDTETYSVGDVCTYNGQLYKCETAVSTAETFDPTKWAAIVVTELSGGHNYSTSEQVVGTWIDGTPVYEKTFFQTSASTGSGSEVSIDVSNLNIDKCISVGGTFNRYRTDSSFNSVYEFNTYEGNDMYGWVRYTKNANTINYKISLPDQFNATNEQYITIRYTKSTS